MKLTKSSRFAALLLALLLCAPMGADAALLPCSTAAYRPPVHWQVRTACPRWDHADADAIPAVPDTVPDAAPDAPDTVPDYAPDTDSAAPDAAPVPNPAPDAVPGTDSSAPEAAPETDGGATSASILPYEAEVIRLVNEVRAQHGLDALAADADLCRFARLKSQDMRDNRYFSHDSPAYGTPFQMMKSLGVSYRTAGENIAYGYTSPQAVMEGWMNSEGHRANILNPSYTRIGVGYVAEGHYWTQWFIG